MPVPAPKGLALTGSILAIVVGALALIGGVMLLGVRHEIMAITGIIAIAFGVTGIVLGAIGCTIKPGPILANAIVFSLLTLLGLMGIFMGRPNPVQLIGLVLYATTTVFLYVGFAQARRYQEAQRAG